MTTIETDEFGLPKSTYEVFSRGDGKYANWRPGTDLTPNGPVNFHHSVMISAANQLQILRDFAFLLDDSGRPLFDIYQIEVNGRALPTVARPVILDPVTGETVSAFSQHANGYTHLGWKTALTSSDWFGDLNADWINTSNWGQPPFSDSIPLVVAALDWKKW